MHLENCTLEKRDYLLLNLHIRYICKSWKENNPTSNIQQTEVSKRIKNQTDSRNAIRDGRSSEEGRRADALALGADERRDKLRKAAGRSKYPVIRGCLNGETRQSNPLSPYGEFIAIRREPGELKHLSSRRKRKKLRFPE